MSETEAETAFRKIRWSETDGEPVCPECGGVEPYEYRRPTGLLRFRCKACSKNFSITSGTLFAAHKAPLRTYLAAIAVAMNEVKGKNALALSRDLGMSHKACWVLAAQGPRSDGGRVQGPQDRRRWQSGGSGWHVRRVATSARQIFARTAATVASRSTSPASASHSLSCASATAIQLPAVFRSEGAALSWIKSRVEHGTVLNADEASGWDGLASKYEMKRINHQEAYSDGEACTNQAESYFSRIRRAEMGHFHHVSGPYLLRYAQESAFREDARRVDNGTQVRRVTELALKRGPSVDFSGYYQRHIKAA